jgi:hypothetical protein
LLFFRKIHSMLYFEPGLDYNKTQRNTFLRSLES